MKLLESVAKILSHQSLSGNDAVIDGQILLNLFKAFYYKNEDSLTFFRSKNHCSYYTYSDELFQREFFSQVNL